VARAGSRNKRSAPRPGGGRAELVDARRIHHHRSLATHPQEDLVAYVIIVEFRARPDQVEAFAALIDRHAYNSRREDGCLAFEVCQDPEDPARFVFYEAYRDQAAHRVHAEQASYQHFRSRAPELLVAGPRGALPQQRQVLTCRPYLSE
jgi:(4S)-4-hydroxy-5-phosphonooxypentane-2,3-dione isomerase